MQHGAPAKEANGCKPVSLARARMRTHTRAQKMHGAASNIRRKRESPGRQNRDGDYGGEGVNAIMISFIHPARIRR